MENVSVIVRLSWMNLRKTVFPVLHKRIKTGIRVNHAILDVLIVCLKDYVLLAKNNISYRVDIVFLEDNFLSKWPKDLRCTQAQGLSSIFW